MHILPRRQFLRHKADLDKGPQAIGQKPVIDLINVREVVDGIPSLVLVIDSNFIMENVVEPHIPELSDLLHFTQIVAITLPQCEDCAPRTERLLPEMRKGMAGRVSVDRDWH